jgi:predicted phosphodiesterase
MRANIHGRKLINDLLAKFPDSSSHQIARMAYADSPKLFSNVENARCMVRYARGAMGNGHRKKATVPPTKHTIYGMPKSIPTFVDWKPYQIAGPKKVLTLSDVHAPFHDERAVEAAVEHGKKEGCNVVLLNGDVTDNHSISRWETDPRERDFGEEIRVTIQMLEYIRGVFPKADIVWKKGNHEERYDSYMRQKAPELLGVDAFQWSKVYEVERLGVTVVGESRPVHVGKLPVIHGHEYKFAISNPVNPARGLFLRAKESALCGHHHLMSTHREKSLSEHEHTTYSTGCLCQMRYKYAPINNHTQGFATIEIDKEGAWRVDNLKVIRGKVW